MLDQIDFTGLVFPSGRLIINYITGPQLQNCDKATWEMTYSR